MKNKLSEFFEGMGGYFVPLVLFWLLLGIWLFEYGENTGFVYLNAIRLPVIDHPALWAAEISGGYILASLFVISYARSKPATAIFGIALIFVVWYTSITIKYNHFVNWRNPSVTLKGSHIHLLGNQQLQPELNFPSSHAAMVIALFLFIAWLYRESSVKTTSACLIAVLLCYTRIYTGWSYLGDILSGSILGVIIAIPMIVWFLPKTEHWYENLSEWWQNMIKVVLRAAAVCTIIVNLKCFVL